jgi:hypothetical protein
VRRLAFLMLERDLERVGENQETEIIRRGPKADCFDRWKFLKIHMGIEDAMSWIGTVWSYPRLPHTSAPLMRNRKPRQNSRSTSAKTQIFRGLELHDHQQDH